MNKMYCTCGGIEKQFCKCKTWNYVYDPNETNIVFMPTQHSFAKHKESMLTIFLHNLFDVCLGYNVRYCGLRESSRKSQAIRNATTDLILLLCFLLTNSIVFFTLLTRITIHIGQILFGFMNWTHSRVRQCSSLPNNMKRQ